MLGLFLWDWVDEDQAAIGRTGVAFAPLKPSGV